MPKRIDDEVLDTITVVATHDELAAKLEQRYGSVATGLEFGIPIRDPGDREALIGILRALHR